MSLPTYDKSKRKKAFEALPKDAYVIRILNAKEVENKSSSGSHLAIAFDIAEGDYKNFYKQQFDANRNEDKKWPNDAVYYLGIPSEGCQQFVIDNWNTFFADLEDSNNGFVFDGEPSKLKGKIIGGKFHIEQSEYRGQIYNHTRLRWTCLASDVRDGKALRSMPNDKLIEKKQSASASDDSFMNVPADTDEEIPFD